MPYMDLKKRLATALREARQRLDLTQEELAKAAGFPHFQTISEIELGERDVKAVELAMLSRALHVPLNDLISGALPPAPTVLWRNPPRRSKVTEASFIEKCRTYRW